MAVKVTLAGKCVELLPFDSAGTDGSQCNSYWKMCRVIALCKWPDIAVRVTLDEKMILNAHKGRD